MNLILPIFCLLMIAGALSSWRSSPLYSNKTAVKLLGAFLLTAAALVGVSFAITSAASYLSQPGQAVVAVAAILLVTSGSSILLIRVTDSHVAQLPAAMKMVSLHRHRVMRWIWRFLIFELGCTAAGWLLPGAWGWLSIGIGGFLLILCGPMLAIFFMMARRNDRSFTAVMAAPWVHWKFSRMEWEAWGKTQRDWERAREERWNVRQTFFLILLCMGLFAVGAFFSGGSVLENVLIVAALTGFVALLLATIFFVSRSSIERRYRRLVSLSAEVYLGDEGVYCDGSFTPWVLSGKYLVEAKSTREAPACLTLTFQSFAGGGSRLVCSRLPVPADHLSDLDTLQAKLRARCPAASVQF